MKTKNASFILAAAFGVLTTTANAWWGGRPPIPVPGDPCPPSYHLEQVNRTGGGFNGSVGFNRGFINGNASFQMPQQTQQFQHCYPNERRGMGNYPMPAPMPRPQSFTPGPRGPMPQSTPMWMIPRW